MNVIWSKIRRDLFGHTLRTLLVIFSTAVGVFALGLVFSLSTLMTDRMEEDYFRSSPAHIEIWGGPFEQKMIEQLNEIEGITSVQGETTLNFRWKMDGEQNWRDGSLVSRNSYTDQTMNYLNLMAGYWPGKRDLTIERQSALYYGINENTHLVVQFEKSQQLVWVDGLVRDPAVFPPQFGGDPTFFVSKEAMYWITGYADFNTIHIQIDGFTQERAQEIAAEVKYRLNRAGLNYGGYFITDPGRHWMQETLDTLSIILAVLGALSLIVGTFLIVNTVIAIMAQQVWQIGVMKVIGADRNDVLLIYLASIFFYGALACVIAIPASLLVSNWGAGWLLGLLNIDPGPFQLVPRAILVQLLTGLLLPVAAAFLPIKTGSAITPYQAISTHGLGQDFGKAWLDRYISRLQFLPGPLALSLRNSFRRKVRVVLTLVTLILAGIMFIVVMSLSTSLNNTMETLINDLGMDVWLSFETPERTQQMLQTAGQIPRVTSAETWQRTAATLKLARGEERDLYLMGLPPDSSIHRPRIVSGRRLMPGDGYAVLLNNKIAVEEGIRVGDRIRLDIASDDSTWMVVGLILDVSEGQTNCYVPLEALARENSSANRANLLMLKVDKISDADMPTFMEFLRGTYSKMGMEPAFIMNAADIRQQSKAQFSLITNLMLAMALLVAVVGSIGLIGTMSLNVVERGREVGVMRSIGAASMDVVGIFLVEGILIGLVSWFAALPFSYPAARMFSGTVGNSLFSFPLEYQYSIQGVWLWFIIVALLSTLASIWPALRASRISVRESLSYE